MMRSKIKSLLGGLLVALAMVFAAPAMADSLDQARAAGIVGERPDGLLGLVDPNAPASVKSLVQSINAQRLLKYQDLAKKQNVPVEQVGAIAGEKTISERVKPGWYYMDSSGNWVQK
jgi:uncharacterized protein YdbL (DUF1318 family)